MKQLSLLLKTDFTLLNRNNVIGISFLITLIYIAVFNALSSLPSAQKLLVLIIFIDPVLLGFLFVGVMVLFEKNENTMQALAVSPIEIKNYMWSKAIALTLISIICCYGMVIAGHGMDFNKVHFTIACAVTTLIFSFIGFGAIAGHSSTNKFILRVLVVVIIMSLPFLGYFGLVDKLWFVMIPSAPAIELLDLAFNETAQITDMVWPYMGSLGWLIIIYFWGKKLTIKAFAQ